MTDELLIDIGDERLIRDRLGKLQTPVGVDAATTDRRLGLTKLSLAISETSSLDAVLGELRTWAADLPGGPPTLDTTYPGGDVSLLPHVKGGVFPATPLDLPYDGDRVPPGRPTGARIGIADARPFAHPDLAGRLSGEPLISSGPFPSGLPGHATFVAGTVLRRAPDATLICRTVLEPDQHTDVESLNPVWDVARRLACFLDDEVDVLNMSFACRTGGRPPLPIRRAIELLSARGVVLVAAGGNTMDGIDEDPAYPAAFPEVLSVGARSRDGSPSDFDISASWLRLQAPGVDVVGPFLQGEVRAPGMPSSFPSGYATWSGSSFAAAFVSGELARRMGESQLDAHAAVDQLLQGGCPDVVPAVPA